MLKQSILWDAEIAPLPSGSVATLPLADAVSSGTYEYRICCTNCHEFKPRQEFYPRKQSPRARHTQCKKCIAAHALAWKRKNQPYDSDAARRTNLHQQYGLTPEAIDCMSEEQGHACAICGDPPKSRLRRNGRIHHGFFVDHDHATGAVRGLLCARCNNGLGQFKDNIDLMQLAIDYLSRHNYSR